MMEAGYLDAILSFSGDRIYNDYDCNRYKWKFFFFCIKRNKRCKMNILA